MRRVRVAVLWLSALAAGGLPAPRAAAGSLAGGGPVAARSAAVALSGPCTPESPVDVPRPPSCQRIRFAYGPLHVTPGDNLILFGPVSIQKPPRAGWVVRFKPDLVRPDGSVPGIEQVHLHHAVWLSSRFADPMFASGEEKTIISLPDGYGLRTEPRDVWLLNYMLHNQTPLPENLFITYTIDFVPDGTGITLRGVEPYWIDVGSFNGANPVYNTQRGYGAVPGECAFPREQCAAFDPYGRVRTGQGQPGNGIGHRVDPPEGTVVWMGGHLHPGGLRLELDLERGSQRVRVFTSRAVYFDPNGPVSWDMAMQVTRPGYRLRISPGDRLVLNSVYDSARASWYEGMGIVVAFVAKGDDSGPDAFSGAVDPDRVDITHGHLPEASRHGGGGEAPLPPAPELGGGTVGIGGFAYLPGDLNQGPAAVVAVRRGEPVTFLSLDPPPLIFHTVTACRYPCNGATGISYPLADGPLDFDSLELGLGPPGVTAASNRLTYELDTTALPPGTYTYFCRVHPFMRGAFEVRP